MKRTRKPFLRVMAALMAALLLSSCGLPEKTTTTAEEETEDPNVGRYYLAAANREGVDAELSEDELEDYYLRLKDDGKATMQINADKYEGSWKAKKDVLTLKLDDTDTFKKEEYEGSIEDGKVEIEVDGIRMVFVKGKSAAKEYMKAHPATQPETTEAPTTEPETTEKAVEWTVYYILQWNNWHPERDDVMKNSIEFPDDGSPADLYLDGKYYQLNWTEISNGYMLEIDGRDFLATFNDTEHTRLSITSGDLQTYFVLGDEKALEVWDFAYGQSETKPTEEPSTEEPATKPTEEPETKPSGEAGDFSVEKQVICNRDGIKVTVLGTGEDYWGKGLEIEVENNSKTEIYVASNSVSVNGAMQEEDFFCRAGVGEKATDILYLDEEYLARYSISTIGYIDISLRAVNRETYDTIFTEDEPVRIKTSEFGREDSPKVPEDSVLLHDEDGVKIYFVHLGVDDYGTLYSRMCVVNNTKKSFSVDVESVELNDIEVEGWIYNDTVQAGCMLLCDIEYEEDSLEENELTDPNALESADFILYAYDWEAHEDLFVTDEIGVDLVW